MKQSEDRLWLAEVLKDAAQHTQSSPQTLSLFKSLDDKVNDLKCTMDKGFEKIHATLEADSKKYASRTTQNIVYGFAGIVLTWFVGGLLGLFALPTIRDITVYFLNLIA